MAVLRPSGRTPPQGVIIGIILVLLGIFLGGGGALLPLPTLWTTIPGVLLFVVGAVIFLRTTIRHTD